MTDKIEFNPEKTAELIKKHGRHIHDEDAQEERLRDLIQLDKETDLNRRNLQNKLRENFDELSKHNGELRPHIRFPLDSEAFENAIKKTLDGEVAGVSAEGYVIDFDAWNDMGTIQMGIDIQQLIESTLTNPDMWDVEYSGPDDYDTVISYYDGEPALLQPEVQSREFPSHYVVDTYYTTLLRDMSNECAEAVDTMHEVVDAIPDVHWGGEPKLTRVGATYRFASTLRVR
ncbi:MULTISPECIES: hypothetical protein [Haloferax]|uniref:Uncharacterized protein n=2 Tax=Haloferax TaxID=2251 RepID=A0A6G1Z735_9EURY|nr:MULTISPECIES: hypothetical protein [Haloferax]KAB1184815.1 hypothetical protein Hfx1149_17280 [Haloferax sp. CBA1149]MRW82447.1 hypothetical protein [Haloferax marinisediminis]